MSGILTRDQMEAQIVCAMITGGRRDLSAPAFARDLEYAVKEAMWQQEHGKQQEHGGTPVTATTTPETEARTAQDQAEVEALRELIKAGRTDFQTAQFIRDMKASARRKLNPPRHRSQHSPASADPAPSFAFRSIRRKVNGETLYALGGALRQGSLF